MVSAQDAHIKDLVDTATAALRAGNPQAALKLMRQAEAAAPGDVGVQMQLALVLRSSGDLEAARGRSSFSRIQPLESSASSR